MIFAPSGLPGRHSGPSSPSQSGRRSFVLSSSSSSRVTLTAAAEIEGDEFLRLMVLLLMLVVLVFLVVVMRLLLALLLLTSLRLWNDKRGWRG